MGPSPATSSLLPERLLRVALMVALLCFGWHLWWSVRALFVHTLDLGGVEGNVVYGIQRLLLGLPLYTDPESPPFAVIQYTPLYYYLAAAVGLLTGVDAQEPQEVFVLGRVLCLLFNLGTVWATYRMGVRFGTARPLAAFFALLVFALLTRHFLGRPDALYLLLFTLSMADLFRALAPGHTTRGRLATAALWACAAVLTKQSGVLALGIIGASLLWLRRWRDLGLTVGLCGSVLLTAFFLLGVRYGGEELYRNIVIGVRNGLSLEIFQHVFLQRSYLLLGGLHLAGAVLAWHLLQATEAPRKALAIALVLSFLFALVTGLKSGSRLNYFLENFVLIAVALPFAATFDRPRRPLLALLMVYATCSLVAAPLRFAGVVRHFEEGTGPQEYAEAARTARFLRAHERLAPGELVFVLRRDFVEHFLVGHSVLDQKDILHFSRTPLYDYERFHQAMREGEVRFVLTRRPVERVHFMGRSYPDFRPIDAPEGIQVLEHVGHGLR